LEIPAVHRAAVGAHELDQLVLLLVAETIVLGKMPMGMNSL
jgi:hypothetical protein